MRKLAVKQDPKEEIPTEIMAAEIVAISQGIKKLRAGRLNDRALFLLVQAATPSIKFKPISLKTVKAVFEGIENLEGTFLKKKAP